MITLPFVTILAFIIVAVIIVILQIRADKLAKAEKQKTKTDGMAEFSATQLIGGERFLFSYDEQLKALHDNEEFMRFILLLRTKMQGNEIKNTSVVNKTIADEFFYQRINDKFPKVKEIVDSVKVYGKQASAHISIYYAMYLYDARK